MLRINPILDRVKERQRKREMAKFSVGGDDDGEGPSNSGSRRKRQRLLRFDSRTQQNPQTQPQTPPPQSTIGEGNNSDEYAEEDSDDSEDDEDGSDHEEDEWLGGETDAWLEFEQDTERNPPQVQIQAQVPNSSPPRSAVVAGQGAREPGGSSRDGSVTLTLVDPDVLDCSICFDPLCAPVYQCENGHISCSSCCTKMRNKCPSCSWPIGYNRCRAIEKVLESIKVSCLNHKYGCNETLSFSKRSEHEKICLYVPCSCPIAGCSFLGSSKVLYAHFTSKHSSAAERFKYNSHFNISMQVTDRHIVLQELLDGTLFIISNGIQTLGNAISISCIGPSTSKERFRYDVTAKMQETSLNLASSMKITESRGDNSTETGFLLIPTGFSGTTRQLTLNICIWRGNGSHSACMSRNIGS